MDSYIETSGGSKPDVWLVKKFDALYDMDVDALRYLAQIRSLKPKIDPILMM
jgi:hypothetical protein